MRHSVLSRFRAARIPGLGGLLPVQKGKPFPAVQERTREQFAADYTDAVAQIPHVRMVRVRDNISYLDIDTYYDGDVRAIEDAVYEVEASVMKRYPDVLVNWRLLHETAGSARICGAGISNR